MSQTEIVEVIGRRVWDSRGRPTVETEIHLAGGAAGLAMAPAGASTGSGEALDLRDGGDFVGGHDVRQAVNNVNTRIRDALVGLDAADQVTVDQTLIELDGTEGRTHLGGNAMIATSMANAHAVARQAGIPLFESLGDGRKHPLPVPEIQIFGGGAHAEGKMDLQDFMVVPFGASSFEEGIEWVAQIYHVAGRYMDRLGKRTGVADEGGYWPNFDSNEAAIQALDTVIREAGFCPETQVGISLDIAATQVFRDGKYWLKKENRGLNPQDWYDLMAHWVETYPICAIEDPFVEGDFDSHARFTAAYGHNLQVVGDDLLVTNLRNIEQAMSTKACNTLLVKPNQAGTLSEARQAFERVRDAGWNAIVSARSGETEDTTIVHLALGWGVSQLKVGSFARSERMAKWNEAIRWEQRFGNEASYAGPRVFAHRLKQQT